MNSFEIIIPAYNEEENIAGLILTIKETVGESGKNHGNRRCLRRQNCRNCLRVRSRGYPASLPHR